MRSFRLSALALAGLCSYAPAIRAECKFSQTFGSTLFGGGKGDLFQRGPDKVTVKDKKDGKFTLVNPYGEEKEFTQDEYQRLIFNCMQLGRFPAWGRTRPLVEETGATPSQTTGAVEIRVASSGLDLADVDGDGVLDIAQINANNRVVTLVRGLPTGGYATARTQVQIGTWLAAVKFADIDRDGQADLVVAQPGDFQRDAGGVNVLAGARNGTFGPPRRYSAGVAPRSVAVADFNGDGRLDLAVAAGGSTGAPGLPSDPGGLYVLLGQANGEFVPTVQTRLGEQPWSVLDFDFDRDGRRDLAVAVRTPGAVAILRGRGDGTFEAPRNVAVGGYATFLGTADFNGDGRPDLAVLHDQASTISIWLGDSGGGFRANGRYLCGSVIESFDILQPGADERPTIVSPDRAGDSFMILVGDTDGGLVAPPVFPAGQGPRGLAIGDFDGDGRPDAAVGATGRVSVFFSPQPYGTQQPPPLVVTGAGAGPPVAAADFNGDGRADLASAASSTVAVHEGRADRTFGPPTTTFNGASSVEALQALDANGDRRPDLAVLDGNGIGLHLGGPAGLGARVDVGGLGRAIRTAVADFNGDGRDDLLTVSQQRAYVNLGTATGLGAPRGILTGESLSGAAAGDFNGDGRPDAIVCGRLTGAPGQSLYGFALLLGDGAGGFAAPSVVRTDFGPASLAAVDYNRDGALDLVIAHCCGETRMSYWQGLGDGTFRSTMFHGGNSPIAVHAADFDRDGDPELAVLINGDGSSATGGLTILGNNSLPVDHALATGGLPTPLAPDSIISAYGARLSDGTAAAESPAWPEELGGTRVTVRDSAGVERAARIAFASPGQVNYHMPAAVAPGAATVSLTTRAGLRLTTPIRVRSHSAGLFVANEDRFAAAWAIRVKPSGEQILEPVVELSPASTLQLSRIDLSQPGDIVVLQLFGTGLRGAPAGSVKASIGGVQANVLYAGPQNQFPGLDQINIEIPRSLAGRGQVDVTVTVDGERIRPVRIRIR